MGTSHRFSKLIPAIFFTADLFSFNLAFNLASLIKFDRFWYLSNEYPLLQVILNILWFSIFFYSKLYEPNRELGLLDQLNRVFTNLILNLAIVFALWFIAKPYQYSREHLFYLYLFFSLYVIVWRTTWYYTIRHYRARGYNYRNVVIVGWNKTTLDLSDYFEVNKGLGYKFLGYFSRQTDIISRLGDLNVEHIQNYAKQHEVDVIFIYTPYLSEEQIRDLVDFAENNLIKVKLVSQVSDLGYRNIAVSNYGSIPTLNLTSLPLDYRINRLVKRSFDMIFSGLIIIFLMSWLIPLVGLLIKLESPGPIFFKQKRNGLNNRPFVIYKFRSMHIHQDVVVQQAQKNDPRITKIGAFLRKSSIDELPQFLNVFLGDMSVVGPRPHAVKHNEEFQKKIDRFIQRHAVKPGITGLAQCRGFRGETPTFHDINGRVRLDRFYVKNWSLFFDVKIIILTVLALVKRSGNAY
ncbi:MAG: putative colanic acid biosynthesis UDP-glucose lipid carrier transferase [Parvicella sp.]|jgi:putative colanic acid biosynthesis UDP-glucose lipid carrier transferase